jgi:hypothetical protein
MTAYLQHSTIFMPSIEQSPSLNLGLVVVIPAFDEDYLLLTLMCLQKCTLPAFDVEVIVIVNHSIAASPEVRDRNLRIYEQAHAWARRSSVPRLRFHVLYFGDLPEKQAGVGLARKIGMDEACWQFEKIGHRKGIIACLDADSRCDRNYLVEIERHFREHPGTPACSIHFEHPLEGADFAPEVYSYITGYELHLRYFIHAQRWAGFPFAYQTIGSSMAVRCDAYQRQGGMNRRQAGEDFYFLHKFTELGSFTELNSTRVIPSPRPSHRVPFGTGRAIAQMLRSGQAYQTYDPESFLELKSLFAGVGKLQHASRAELEVFENAQQPVMRDFLTEVRFREKIVEIREHTAGAQAFRTRFFRWFNAFQVMKYMHYARDQFYSEVAVEQAASWLLQQTGLWKGEVSARELLEKFRDLDRQRTMAVGSDFAKAK